MEVHRPYDRAQASPAQGHKSSKSPSKRGKDGLTVDVTRLASSPGSRSQPNSKATKYTPSSSIAMDNSNAVACLDTDRRSSRRVERWLNEQQFFSTSRHTRSGSEDSGFWQPPTPKPDSFGAPSNPGLAYPNLAHCPPLFREREDDDDASTDSFVVVEEASTPTNDMPRPVFQVNGNDFTPPATPSTNTFRNTPTTTRTPSRPWRNINLPMTVPARLSSPGAHIALITAHQTPKKSVFRRLPLPDAFRPAAPAPTKVVLPSSENCRTSRQNQHKLDTSITPKASRYRLSSFSRTEAVKSLPGESSSPRPSTSTSSAATSTFVDNYPSNSTLAVPEEKVSASNRFRSRFALSLTKASQRLGASYAVPEKAGTLHNREFVGLESPSKASFVSQDATTSRSTFSSGSSPPSHSDIDTASYLAPSVAVKDPAATMKKKTASIFKERGNNGSTSALSVGRGTVFSSAAKRKKLVVSGLAKGDGAALEGLRKWCETFGELREISRLPNGDLLVDFKRAEVADTVCRISAQVFIDGVGSVFLSWCTGKKR
ncbi:hypothetical protein SCHPADRAFT_934492 [Schizopora paradoxa]|uniref:Uncharacterized protein n=1 Tax=Schizopora paradoxa TaxID=27342 RepID=A0A0H2SU68_9AGAM|nr:hypothetical protein SCHPADRAFT_934492 [Schizopora paradoxa]